MKGGRATTIVSSMLLLAGCGGGPPKPSAPPKDVELAQSLSTARSAFNQGAYAQAASLYGRALKRAEVMDDAEEIANAAYDYAAALIQSGKVADAAVALRESEAEAIRAKQRTTDILLLQ